MDGLDEDQPGPLVPASYTVENPDALPEQEVRISISLSRSYNGNEPGRISPKLPEKKVPDLKKWARERVVEKLKRMMNRDYDVANLADLTDWPKKR